MNDMDSMNAPVIPSSTEERKEGKKEKAKKKRKKGKKITAALTQYVLAARQEGTGAGRLFLLGTVLCDASGSRRGDGRPPSPALGCCSGKKCGSSVVEEGAVVLERRPRLAPRFLLLPLAAVLIKRERERRGAGRGRGWMDGWMGGRAEEWVGRSAAERETRQRLDPSISGRAGWLGTEGLSRGRKVLAHPQAGERLHTARSRIKPQLVDTKRMCPL